MRINQVRRALKAGELQLGMNFGQLRSSEIPKLLAAAGFHWAFVDTEHGNFDLETVNDVCRVAQLAGLCPVVRVARCHRWSFIQSPQVVAESPHIAENFGRSIGI